MTMPFSQAELRQIRKSKTDDNANIKKAQSDNSLQSG